MCRFLVFALFFLINEQTVYAAIIDQRQNGDFNVQIDLKNFKIFGLTKGKEEYVDYDYVYDYSEMTIKPTSGTTKNPLNVTVSSTGNKDNSSAATTTFVELDQTTASVQNDSNTTVDSTTHTVMSNNFSTANVTPTTESIRNNSPTLQCKKGFFRNSKGNCELKLQNPSNALLQMIKQKLKLNSSNSTVSR